MAKNVMPLLLAGGAALLLLGRKKKTDDKDDDVVIDSLPSEEDEPWGEPQEEGIDLPGEEDATLGPQAELKARCIKFINEVWQEVPDAGFPHHINTLAWEQKIAPAMKGTAQAFKQNLGALDSSHVGQIALAGMEAIAPGCQWEIDDSDRVLYAGGDPIDNDQAVEILKSIIDLAHDIVNEGKPKGQFTPQEVFDGGLDIGD